MNPEFQSSTAIIAQQYQVLASKQSNIVLEVLPKDQPIYEWRHYPQGDVKNANAQYYYHSHREMEEGATSIHEHGHFHCFIRKPARFTELKPTVISKKHEADNSKDDLCHLIAIAINQQAQPTALFTLNHWVIQGLWYPAEVVYGFLDYFDLSRDQKQPIVSPWITAMIQLFKPQIQLLLEYRDQVLAGAEKKNIFEDKEFEVLSILNFV